MKELTTMYDMAFDVIFIQLTILWEKWKYVTFYLFVPKN